MRQLFVLLVIMMVVVPLGSAQGAGTVKVDLAAQRIVVGNFWLPKARIPEQELRRAALGVIRLLTDDATGEPDAPAAVATKGMQQHLLQGARPSSLGGREAAPVKNGNVLSFMRPRLQVHIAPPLPPIFAPTPGHVQAPRRSAPITR